MFKYKLSPDAAAIINSLPDGTLNYEQVLRILSDSGFDEAIDNAVFDYLYQRTLNKNSIIFAKSRAEVEQIIAGVRQIAKTNKTKDIYRIHYGSISAALREEAEQDMKISDEPIVTGATVTLELGMEIGSLDRVVQVGSPFSASIRAFISSNNEFSCFRR